MTLDILDLMAKLDRVLPLDLYGKGAAKSVDSLLQEIESGECQLIWENEMPIRVLRVSLITVRSPLGCLWEERQEFHDGRVRFRNLQGVSEKCRPQESFEETAIRGLQEELGLDRAIVTPTLQEIRCETEFRARLSTSYPGLKSHYTRGLFSLWLEQPEPNYVELGVEKNTYFVWKNNWGIG
jgi:NUDIX domain